MSNLLLDFSNIVIRILEIDLFNGDDLSGIVVNGLEHCAEATGAELLEKGIVTCWVASGQLWWYCGRWGFGAGSFQLEGNKGTVSSRDDERGGVGCETALTIILVVVNVRDVR